MNKFNQLIINPGSTSTKLAVFENEMVVFTETLRHQSTELAKFNNISDQYEYRRNLILDELNKTGFKPELLHAVVGRGGLLRPLPGGTYIVNAEMLKDLTEQKRGAHASNLGGLIAHSIAARYGIPAFIVDPVCVDELEPVARISGMPDNPRESLFHALNQKAIARRAAKDLGRSYEDLNLVVAHLGGGISVGVHYRGRVIDVNNAIPGEGPFSPERSGGVPVGRLVDMCFSGEYSRQDIHRKLTGGGGLVAYLGTNDAVEVERRIESGDETAQLIYQAMAYQVAKEIGASSTVLKGKVDMVVVTGGLAHSELLVKLIKEYIEFIAPFAVYPGEDEMGALAAGGLRVLSGREAAQTY